MRTRIFSMTPGLLLAALTLAGCANTSPAWQSMELGGAVAQAVEGQIQNPEAAADPGDAAVDDSDAVKTAKVLEAWRESLAAPKESAGDVTINIGR